MTSTTILIILLVFSFVVGRFLRRFETPNFVFSGFIYLLFGLLLGSHLGLGILTEELLHKLEPLTSLLIGITGCLLGLRVKSFLRNKSIFATGILTGLMVFIAVASTFAFALPQIFNSVDTQIIAFPSFTIFGKTITPEFNSIQFWFCIGIGATACSASLMNLGSASRTKEEGSEIYRVLSLLTTAVQCLAILLIGICLIAVGSTRSGEQLAISSHQWIFFSIFSGIICGLLFSLFIGKQMNKERILLAALGTIIFASGVGVYLKISSLFVAFTTGATISIFSSYEEILKESLTRLEEPIFVLLLVISGATWQPVMGPVWLLPVIYFAVRSLILTQAPQRIYRNMTSKRLTRLGQGLLGQDLMAVAIAVSFAQHVPEIAQMFLTTIFGSIFLNDILASSLLKNVILDNEQTTTVQAIQNEEGAG